MFVPIPGLGVLRSTDGGNLRFELDLTLGELSLGPHDTLPSGEKAAVAVWTAVLREDVPLNGKQLEALVQFISEGL